LVGRAPAGGPAGQTVVIKFAPASIKDLVFILLLVFTRDKKDGSV